jgi:hypothetical protein
MGTKVKGYRMRYAGAHGGGVVVVLPFDPRKGICEACGKSVEREEIKNTALHHWFYAYAPKTVKENPMLALDNTSELCYYCHVQLADPIRALLYASPERVVNVAKLLKGEQLDKFIKVLSAVIQMLKTEKNVNPFAQKLLEKMAKNED